MVLYVMVIQSNILLPKRSAFAKGYDGHNWMDIFFD